MDLLLVPTDPIPAAELKRGDIIVEMPRLDMQPWRGRRRVIKVDVNHGNTVTIDLAFPSTICPPGCDVDPRRCIHWNGGRMTLTVPGDEKEVILQRS